MASWWASKEASHTSSAVEMPADSRSPSSRRRLLAYACAAGLAPTLPAAWPAAIASSATPSASTCAWIARSAERCASSVAGELVLASTRSSRAAAAPAPPSGPLLTSLS
eukprot:scaffold57179_cov27-Tisochrysis_lutea.AAC.2